MSLRSGSLGESNFLQLLSNNVATPEKKNEITKYIHNLHLDICCIDLPYLDVQKAL